jgi:hypothetical protein
MRLHDVLDYQARERPTAEFAVHGDRRVTYHSVLWTQPSTEGRDWLMAIKGMMQR